MEEATIQSSKSCKSCSRHETRRRKWDKSCWKVFNFNKSLASRIQFDEGMEQSQIYGKFLQVSILSESIIYLLMMWLRISHKNKTKVRLELSLSHHCKAYNDYYTQ